MLVVIDVGNTNMVFGIFNGEELLGSFRLKTDVNRTSDEIGLLACEYFRRFGLESIAVEDVIIASVAPPALRRARRRASGRRPGDGLRGRH